MWLAIHQNIKIKYRNWHSYKAYLIPFLDILFLRQTIQKYVILGYFQFKSSGQEEKSLKKDKYNHIVLFELFKFTFRKNEKESNIREEIHWAHRIDICLHYLDKESQMTSFNTRNELNTHSRKYRREKKILILIHLRLIKN